MVNKKSKMSLETYLEKINNITTLKPASKRQYRDKLTKLCRESGKDVEYIMNNPDEMNEWVLKTYTDINMRKAIIQPLFCIFKYIPDTATNNNCIRVYLGLLWRQPRLPGGSP